MKKLKCKILGHTLTKTSKEHEMVKEYKCTRCGKEFTKNGYGKLVILDSYWKENNENLRAFYTV
ncbi:hypothetical protein SCB49_06947 [unidentified eubacterium SCB49]|nr:hypothetical protein SCB49_06947 [unidentified eubacterium SCB49]